MRELKIREIDSECYVIETTDFKNDDIVYHWDQTSSVFYSENKRFFKREYLNFKENQTIGDAINTIMRIEREASDVHYRNLARSRLHEVPL